MEVKELRIGNLVKTRKDDYFTKNGITEVKSIDYDSINGYNDGRVSDKNEIKNLSGIPLTEEWLFKFKITKWILGNRFEVRLNESYSVSIYAWQNGVSIFICHLDYVHQFQNWYYLHSKGEELPLKN